MNAILIGSVVSSQIVLEALIKNHFKILKVYALDTKYSKNVSGYYPIHATAKENNLLYKTFRKINEEEIIKEIADLSPDYIFAVGLSQLLSKRIIESAKIGVVGFHPTALPKHRGRAAMVWQMLLGVRETKCSLFFIDEGVDSGDILGQEEYLIGESDYASDVERKLLNALENLCDRVFLQMRNGTLRPVRQNKEEATYLLKRTPQDGRIDWNDPIGKIHCLIRATSRPYPGAFTHYKGKHKIIIWRAACLENHVYTGFPGQIAKVTDCFTDVLCRDGILRIEDYSNEDGVSLREGERFK